MRGKKSLSLIAITSLLSRTEERGTIVTPVFGVSFSAPYARHLGISPLHCLEAAATELGVKRLRLMSYWSQLEPDRGSYNWKELDWQIELAERYDIEVTLCLGLRQPRWPESHWPDWAKSLPAEEWQASLMEFITAVVDRYKGRTCIISYQLENEALNRSFGENGDFDRRRLRDEFTLVKHLDPTRPIIMTTSNSWGIPLRSPRPNIYGFSIYRYFYKNGKYRYSSLLPDFIRYRAVVISLLVRRSCFIHELQAEPWGLKPIPEMSLEEQFKSIDPSRVKEAVEFAKQTRLTPIDLWGLEWWYYLSYRHSNTEIWSYMKSVIRGD